MKDQLEKAIRKFILESNVNWSKEMKDHYFDEPVIRYASADDPLFENYKSIISNDHLTPKELFEFEFGPDSYHGGTVISIVLPISEKLRRSNRSQTDQPSKEWAIFNMNSPIIQHSLGNFITEYLNKLKYRTICPVINSKLYKIDSSKFISNWSERHVAYVAGQGTFGINDGFITDKGNAVRFLSLITDLVLTPDKRTAKNHTEYCLYLSHGLCGLCMKRCPAKAITVNGHDKMKCWNTAYGEKAKQLAKSCGGNGEQAAGCALCQTNVPCEYKIPNLHQQIKVL